MHAEQTTMEDANTVFEAEDQTTNEQEMVTQQFGNIMDVLMPANPPQPKNARIIRRFDLEAAKNDPRPGDQPRASKAEQEARRRQERAQRNQSLFAAAGLV